MGKLHKPKLNVMKPLATNGGGMKACRIYEYKPFKIQQMINEAIQIDNPQSPACFLPHVTARFYLSYYQLIRK